MGKFNHGIFMQVLRDQYGRVPTKLYNALMPALEAGLSVEMPAAPATSGMGWLDEARRLIGEKEIRGPRHNNWIAQGWARLGAGWFNDDETPWCGFFVAHCVDKDGLSYPGRGLFARAKAWLDWGEACQPCVGAVVVFGRNGGGHVGFLVGESASNYYVLGGNQRNEVNIMPIAKSRKLGFRWPKGRTNPNTPLPARTGGIVSRNEA